MRITAPVFGVFLVVVSACADEATTSTTHDWLLVETFSDVWAFETISLITGEWSGRAEISGSSYYVITDRDIFLASQSG